LIDTGSPDNQLSGVERLANTFSIMRHGQSRANVAGIIVSNIETDRRGDYGLSELGQIQALEAAQACDLPRDTVIFSSDFARARQTAEIVRAQLDAPPVTLTEALRERSFGDWEGSATDNYARVWAADETDSDQVGAGVEPVAAVLDRTTALIVDLERRHSGRHILLVSHGDTLQILQAGFLRLSPTGHRRLPPLGTAEIRQLRLEERAASHRLAAVPPVTHEDHRQSIPRASRTTGSSSVPRPRQSSPGSRIFSAPRIDA
jgi:probable phosphoglycerate mutase